MEQRIIELEMGITQKAAYPDNLWSGGIGPCIAVGLWHKPSKSGYMIHDITLEAGLPALLQRAKEECGGLSGICAYAVGASQYYIPDNADEEDELAFLSHNRRFVEQTLYGKLKKNKVKIQWLAPFHVADLYLDMKKGFSVEIQRESDLRFSDH